MSIVAHIVNTPNENARNAYSESWTRIDEQGLHHPRGRQSHTALMVGNVLHVVDVWDSEDDMNAFMTQLGPILDEFGMRLAAPPEIGELLQSSPHRPKSASSCRWSAPSPGNRDHSPSRGIGHGRVTVGLKMTADLTVAMS